MQSVGQLDDLCQHCMTSLGAFLSTFQPKEHGESTDVNSLPTARHGLANTRGRSFLGNVVLHLPGPPGPHRWFPDVNC